MLLLSLFVIALPALADDSALCPSAATIKQKYGQSCHQNSVFAQSAAVCLKRVQQSEALLQAQLNLLLAAQVAAAEDQAKAIAGQVASLTRLTASLGGLESQATLVKDELKRYAASFTLPASIPLEQIKALGLADFFAGFPCYSANQASLSESIVIASDEVEQIRKSNVAARELLRKTSAASATFTASPAVSSQVHGVDRGAAPSATPTAPSTGPSDITGTQKKKDEL